MLSGVLNSDVAVQVSIRIMNTFVAMRKALASIAPLLARIDANERRQIADQAKNDANQVRNEERFKLILDAMQDKRFPPQKVFYDGQIYDAFAQMKKFVRMARSELIVIGPYFADSVLLLVAQKMTVNTQMLGNAALMALPKVAFLASRRVAPAAVMRFYDWATEMRGGGRGAIALPVAAASAAVPACGSRGRAPYRNGRDARCPSATDKMSVVPVRRVRRPRPTRAAKMAALHTVSPSGMIDMSAKRLYHTRALARIGAHAQT